MNIATIIYQYSQARGISRTTVVICDIQMTECRKRLLLIRRTEFPGATEGVWGAQSLGEFLLHLTPRENLKN